jgi:hypothetical protein
LKLAAIGVIALSGCSLAFPLDAYDEGATGSGLSPSTGGGDVGGGGGGGNGGGGGEGGSPPACNGGPNPPLSDITSDFDTSVGENLYLQNCAAIVDGEVHSDPAVMGEFCWVGTTGARRLACDAVTVRILDAGNQFGVHRLVYIRENGGPGELNVLQENNSFGGDLDFTSASFDIVEDAWWRVSANETTITFSTSPDGLIWSVKGTAVPTFPLDDINIAVGSGMWQMGASPSLDRFDCFNVGPPCGD